MEHAIGEIITLPDGRKVEVVESNGELCLGCIMYFPRGKDWRWEVCEFQTHRPQEHYLQRNKGGINMATIEERAKEFALRVKDIDCGDCESCSKCNDYTTYVGIATEQKAIDIEKACEWMKNNLGYYNRHEVHLGKSYEEVVIDDFRKAMEE